MREMNETTICAIPLYRVLHEPLSLEEVSHVVGPTLQGRQKVIEIAFSIDWLGPVTAVGIFQGSTKLPMRHLFMRCDYYEPPGHFIAIEELEVVRLKSLFPGRFARVYGVYETPYV